MVDIDVRVMIVVGAEGLDPVSLRNALVTTKVPLMLTSYFGLIFCLWGVEKDETNVAFPP